MMDDSVREKLAAIIDRYGRALIEDAPRCEGLMRDGFPQQRREIAVLTIALDERVPAELLSSGDRVPHAVLLTRLAARLRDEVAMEESAAAWAVRTWALALGVVSSEELRELERAEVRSSNAPQQPSSAAPPAAAAQTPRYEGARQTATRVPLATPAPAATSSPSRNQQPGAAQPVAQTAARVAAPATYVVAADGGGDFARVSDALLRAAPGSRLVVRPGVYHESLVIDKAIEITGDGARDQIVVLSTRASCIVSRAADATVRNLTLLGRAREQDADAAGFFAVDVERGRLLLEDCAINSDSLSCVAIHNRDAAPVIRRCSIGGGADSGVYAFDDAGGQLDACDIFENSNIGVAITGGARISVTGCQVHHGADAGIVVWDGAESRIEDTEVYLNASSGVAASDRSDVNLRGCRIHDGASAGVFVHRAAHLALEDCDVRRHVETEVAVTSDGDVRLNRCVIGESGGHGVFVRDAGRMFAEECHITGNNNSGVHIDAGGVAVVRRCRIDGNAHVAISCEAGGVIDAEGSDLRGNRVAAWQTDYGSHVESRGNLL